MRELLPSLRGLAAEARAAGIGFTIDAEEADRLELSLDLIEPLALGTIRGNSDPTGNGAAAMLLATGLAAAIGPGARVRPPRRRRNILGIRPVLRKCLCDIPPN